ncbi:Hypothetical protein CAP_2217 [Chondromyces apiculatus DSM 436]|uniref:Uncharacterized protein n=1 Tax=Chondromyces apiculatus DSM 436 TaxID=1192034 RepID=A0A017TAS3_9BACT|nr:Hypothetical protein CAP_2217 [Chondromyces apiculatus DSM 436]
MTSGGLGARREPRTALRHARLFSTPTTLTGLFLQRFLRGFARLLREEIRDKPP